jgi:acetylornithine/succinyldiaminopimelate/putrescine aminotransferase
VLAAKNATLRLRSPTGHVFSFTDLTSANGVVNFGHLNPAIDPFSNLASDLATSFYPPSAASFAEWLSNKLGLDAYTVLYQVGGVSAVSTAIDMARRTRPGMVLVIAGSSHDPRGNARNTRVGNSFLRVDTGSEFSAWDVVSCILYEPIQGADSSVPLPLAWLRGLSQAAQAAGVIAIADEIQCGFFRFGKLSMAASAYLNPDILLFGNSMTNGIYPLSAVVCPEALGSAFLAGERRGEHAFQTASLGFQAAECVAKYIDSTDIEGQVEQIHSLLSRLGERLAANPCLSNLHLAGPTLSLEVRDGKAGKLVQACEEKCVLVGVGGRGRVRIAPPTTVPLEQLTSALKIVEQAAGGL